MKETKARPALRSREERDALVLQWRYLPRRVVDDLLRKHHLAPKLIRFGLDDAEQVGFLALIRSAELYDPSVRVSGKPVKFNTYAYRSIWCRILRHVCSDGLIHVPVAVLEERQGHCSPCQRENRERARHILRLQLEREQDQDFLVPAVEPPDLSDADQVEHLLRKLFPRQREVIHLRFLSGLTLHEAGARMGISNARADQLEKSGLRRLREIVFGRPTGLRPSAKGRKCRKCGVRVTVNYGESRYCKTCYDNRKWKGVT